MRMRMDMSELREGASGMGRGSCSLSALRCTCCYLQPPWSAGHAAPVP